MTLARALPGLLLALSSLTPLAAAPLPPGDAPRADWRAVLAWPQGCEDDWQASGNGRGIDIHRLPDGRRLVEIACTPGAYQGYQLYYLVAASGVGDAPSPLVFPLYSDPGMPRKALQKAPGSAVWGTPDFDRSRGRLRVVNRFRGPGDCGINAVYAFDAQGVRLVELRAKRNCDGRGATHPERWPRVPVHD